MFFTLVSYQPALIQGTPDGLPGKHQYGGDKEIESSSYSLLLLFFKGIKAGDRPQRLIVKSTLRLKCFNRLYLALIITKCVWKSLFFFLSKLYLQIYYHGSTWTEYESSMQKYIYILIKGRIIIQENNKISLVACYKVIQRDKLVLTFKKHTVFVFDMCNFAG